MNILLKIMQKIQRFNPSNMDTNSGQVSLTKTDNYLTISKFTYISLAGTILSLLSLFPFAGYRIYFWVTSLVLYGVSLWIYYNDASFTGIRKSLLLLNSGILIFGIPLKFVSDYMDFFKFLGGLTTIVGVTIFLLCYRQKLPYQNLLSSAQPVDNNSQNKIIQNDSFEFKVPNLSYYSIILLLLIFLFILNQLLFYKLNTRGALTALSGISNSINSSNNPGMKLTQFDIAMLKERMDKNNDGKCDSCGVPLETCIKTGQIDCNMGNNPNSIGVLGSAHVHADFKVYVNGKALDFAKEEYFMKSSLIHVDNNQNKEDASGVLHMEAQKVPLWYFFRSIGMKLEKDSLTLSDGSILKNENGMTLKFFLDGKKVDELADYSFQNLDKLLISYGAENDAEISKQIQSVTSFALTRVSK